MATVYFDGECNLCNAFVDFLIRRDHQRSLRFAPLQGVTARRRLANELTVNPGSVVFEDGQSIVTESTAAIRVLATLGGPWRLFLILLAIPKFVRDPAYRVIARYRYRWFGRRNSCRVPTSAERAYFLD